MIVLFRCYDSDDDYSFLHLDIGIILIEHEGDVLSSSLRLNPASLKIIIEGDFVMDNIEDLSKAMSMLYGLRHCISTILNLWRTHSRSSRYFSCWAKVN